MIDRQLASFLEEGLGIHIGSRNERHEPNGARAIAVKVEEGGRHILVYVATAGAARVLTDLKSNGQAALVFGRPIDDRACQVKGLFVSERPAEPDEQPFLLAQWGAFLVQLEAIGIPRAAASGWVTWPAVAIRLEATAVFEQTPGPQAGVQLR
jgi:hypothetical protein